MTTSIFIDLIQYNNRLQRINFQLLKNKEKVWKQENLSDV
ncbi:hypothetical protein SFK404_5379 [Shigella flexneri K-404]|nr:hypothetical protein SFK272_0236 [Shigella flexneri K-272]EIQ19706.1 hypothetical protein SFK404_5379 [Shigella flexneri K-404]